MIIANREQCLELIKEHPHINLNAFITQHTRLSTLDGATQVCSHFLFLLLSVAAAPPAAEASAPDVSYTSCDTLWTPYRMARENTTQVVAHTRWMEPADAADSSRQSDTSGHRAAKWRPRRVFSRFPTAVSRKRKTSDPIAPPPTVAALDADSVGFSTCMAEKVKTARRREATKEADSFRAIAASGRG